MHEKLISLNIHEKRQHSFNQLAYNDFQSPGIQQKSANEPALRSLPTKRSVSEDSEQSQENVLRRQGTCDEHVKLCGEDNGWREVSEQGFWGLVREEQRGVPLGFKVLGE